MLVHTSEGRTLGNLGARYDKLTGERSGMSLRVSTKRQRRVSGRVYIMEQGVGFDGVFSGTRVGEVVCLRHCKISVNTFDCTTYNLQNLQSCSTDTDCPGSRTVNAFSSPRVIAMSGTYFTY